MYVIICTQAVKGVCYMATQIAPTPTIRNKEVISAILTEVNKKPTVKSKRAVKKLERKFSKMCIKL